MNKKFIDKTLELAINNVKENKGGPFGCIIIKNNKIIGKGVNKVTLLNDPTAHAEICAIREACKNINNFSLKDCVMYSSCEPCPMCLSAIYWSRIKTVYYCNTKHEAANIGFDDNFIYDEFNKLNKNKSINIIQINSKLQHEPFFLWKKSKLKTKY